MLRCIRLYTDEHGKSRAQEGHLQYQEAERGDITTAVMQVDNVVFKETPVGAQAQWHADPGRHFVITLRGCLHFETEAGEEFELQRGVLLLAEETGGQGHRWQMVGDEPWVRAYVQLPAEAEVSFLAKE